MGSRYPVGLPPLPDGAVPIDDLPPLPDGAVPIEAASAPDVDQTSPIKSGGSFTPAPDPRGGTLRRLPTYLEAGSAMQATRKAEAQSLFPGLAKMGTGIARSIASGVPARFSPELNEGAVDTLTGMGGAMGYIGAPLGGMTEEFLARRNVPVPVQKFAGVVAENAPGMLMTSIASGMQAAGRQLPVAGRALIEATGGATKPNDLSIGARPRSGVTSTPKVVDPYAPVQNPVLPKQAAAQAPLVRPERPFDSNEIIQRHITDEGSTTDPRTGRNMGDEDLHFVGVHPELTHRAKGPTAQEEFETWLARPDVQKALDEPGSLLGTSWDKAKGRDDHVYDVVRGIQDRAEAKREGLTPRPDADGNMRVEDSIWYARDKELIPLTPDEAPASGVSETTAVPKKKIRVEHLTPTRGLTEITPEQYGTGALSMFEKKRGAPPATFFYREGIDPEAKVLARARGGEVLTSEIDEDLLRRFEDTVPDPDALRDVGDEMTAREFAIAKERAAYEGQYGIVKSFGERHPVIARRDVPAAAADRQSEGRPIGGLAGEVPPPKPRVIEIPDPSGTPAYGSQHAVRFVDPDTGESVIQYGAGAQHTVPLEHLTPTQKDVIRRGKAQFEAGLYDPESGKWTKRDTATQRALDTLDQAAKRPLPTDDVPFDVPVASRQELAEAGSSDVNRELAQEADAHLAARDAAYETETGRDPNTGRAQTEVQARRERLKKVARDKRGRNIRDYRKVDGTRKEKPAAFNGPLKYMHTFPSLQALEDAGTRIRDTGLTRETKERLGTREERYQAIYSDKATGSAIRAAEGQMEAQVTLQKTKDSEYVKTLTKDLTPERRTATFDTGEAIKEFDDQGNPVFGTTLKDGTVRYDAATGKQMWDALDQDEQNIVRIVKAAYEQQRATENVISTIDGYMPHVKESQVASTWDKLRYLWEPPGTADAPQRPRAKSQPTVLRAKKAGPRMARTDSDDYVHDIASSLEYSLHQFTQEREYNKFLKQLVLVGTRPFDPKVGLVSKDWMRIPRTMETRSGQVIGQVGGGRQIPINMWNEIKPRVDHAEAVKQVGELVSVFRDFGNYSRMNMLTLNPGSISRNFVGGGIQYGTMMMEHLFRGMLDLDLSQFSNDVKGLADAFRLDVVKERPEGLFGARSNTRTQYDPPVTKLGQVANKGMEPFAAVENYFKRAIMQSQLRQAGAGKLTAQQVADNRALLAKANQAIDQWAFNYSEIPKGLEGLRKSALGSLAMPFPVYGYKIARMYGRYAAALNPVVEMSRKDRAARIMVLGSMAAGIWAARAGTKEGTRERGRVAVGGGLGMRTMETPWLGFANPVKTGQQALSVGPLAQAALAASGMRNEYNLRDSMGTIMGQTLGTFVPGARLTASGRDIIESYKGNPRSFPENFGQALARPIPGTPTMGKKGKKKLEPGLEWAKALAGINLERGHERKR